MRKPSSYPTAVPSAPDRPYGEYQNATDATDATDGTDGTKGTKIEAEHVNDPLYGLFKVLWEAGMTPNDTSETIASSQFYDALEKLYNKEWSAKKASNGYKIGAKVLRYGIEYLNLADVNKADPSQQTLLLGSTPAGVLQGNGWQIIKDHNTGQTLQNWLMPSSTDTTIIHSIKDAEQNELLSVIPAPKIESFLYEPKTMEEIAKLGYFPLTLDTDGTPHKFPDNNNLSELQKNILLRYASAGYIHIDDTVTPHTYSLNVDGNSAVFQHLKAGFGLTGFGGHNTPGTLTGGIADDTVADTHLINNVASFGLPKTNLISISGQNSILITFPLTTGTGGTSISNKYVTRPSTPTADPANKYGILIGTQDAGSDWIVNIGDAPEFAVIETKNAQENFDYGRKLERFRNVTDLNDTNEINKQALLETPNNASGLNVCFGIPISSAYKH